MSFFPSSFRNKHFFVTAVGSSTPDYVYQSYFQLEKEMRELWWDIKEGDVVIDVGAAYGSYTLPALALGASRVLFFEPSKTEFFDICSNVMINGWMNRVIPFNCLAGESPGVRDDYFQDSHSYRPEGQKDSRLVLSVDSILQSYNIHRCDWLKVDVEGAEVDVLKGATKTLTYFKPKLLVECHVGFVPGVDTQVDQFLTPLGYKAANKHTGPGINDCWILYNA